jgi:hypothetical protein
LEGWVRRDFVRGKDKGLAVGEGGCRGAFDKMGYVARKRFVVIVSVVLGDVDLPLVVDAGHVRRSSAVGPKNFGDLYGEEADIFEVHD